MKIHSIRNMQDFLVESFDEVILCVVCDFNLEINLIFSIWLTLTDVCACNAQQFDCSNDSFKIKRLGINNKFKLKKLGINN